MEKITELLKAIADEVDKEFDDFYVSKMSSDIAAVFGDAHEIDIYCHLREFFTDTPEEYLSEHEIECLLQRKGRILEELHSFIVNGMTESPYGTYENCAAIVNVFVENGF